MEQFDGIKERQDAVIDAIKEKEAKSARLDEFIKGLQKRYGILEEFDEALWGSMVENVTFKRGKEMVFRFRDGTEVTV